MWDTSWLFALPPREIHAAEVYDPVGQMQVKYC
jgi:hypothetical protein